MFSCYKLSVISPFVLCLYKKLTKSTFSYVDIGSEFVCLLKRNIDARNIAKFSVVLKITIHKQIILSNIVQC